MPWNYISCSRLGRCLVLLERLRDESILEADSSSEARYYSITVSHPESDFHDHLGYTHTHILSLDRWRQLMVRRVSKSRSARHTPITVFFSLRLNLPLEAPSTSLCHPILLGPRSLVLRGSI